MVCTFCGGVCVHGLPAYMRVALSGHSLPLEKNILGGGSWLDVSDKGSLHSPTYSFLCFGVHEAKHGALKHATHNAVKVT